MTKAFYITYTLIEDGKATSHSTEMKAVRDERQAKLNLLSLLPEASNIRVTELAQEVIED